MPKDAHIIVESTQINLVFGLAFSLNALWTSLVGSPSAPTSCQLYLEGVLVWSIKCGKFPEPLVKDLSLCDSTEGPAISENGDLQGVLRVIYNTRTLVHLFV